MLPSASACAVCHKPDSQKCGRCQAVFYCGKEHQREDWSKHKGLCFNYEVQSSSKLGHYIVALRDIKKNEMVFRERPLVLGPRHVGPLPVYCVGCFRAWPLTLGLMVDICPGCEWPACSRYCKGLTNPEGHGAECKLLKIVKKTLNRCPIEIVLPIRCLLLQTMNPKKWKVLKELAVDASAKHVNVSRNGELASLESLIVNRISREAAQFIPDCSATTVKHVFDLLDVDGREFHTPFTGPLEGVYITYCRVVHTCLPNIRITFDLSQQNQDLANGNWKTKIIAHAVKDIPKGELITFGVVNILLPTKQRQKEFFNHWNLRCTCARCLDPHELGLDTGTLMCPDCSGLMVPTDTTKIAECDWACDMGCGKTLATEMVTKFENDLMMKVARTRYGTGGEPSTGKLEALLTALEEFLHPNHYLCFMVRNLLAKFYGRTEEGGLTATSDDKLLKKSELCQQCLKFLESPYLTHTSTNIAEILIEQHRADFELLKRNCSSNLWNKDRTIQELVKCRSLLRGVPEVLSEQCYTSERASLKEQAASLETELISWAKTKGLAFPDN